MEVNIQSHNSRESIYLSNICHAQKTIDKIPLEVEKNILYDIGGEIQRIVEDNYIFRNERTYGQILHSAFDKMLNTIIDRVKDMETHSKQAIITLDGSSLFETSESQTDGNQFSTVNTPRINANKELGHLRTSYNDVSETENLSSFVVMRNVTNDMYQLKRKPKFVIFTARNNLKQKIDKIPKFRHLLTPDSKSLITDTISQKSDKCGNGKENRNQQHSNRSPPRMPKPKVILDSVPRSGCQTSRQNETVSLFTKTSDVLSRKKGKFSY